MKFGKPISDLSDREIEIILLLCDELINIEIGEKLFISDRTVETHRRNIRKKIGCHSVVGIVKYAYGMGYI